MRENGQVRITVPDRPASSPAGALRPAPGATGWRRPFVIGAVPAAVLLALGLYQLSRDQPFWYDEAYSAVAARTPLAQLFSAVWHRTGLVSYLLDVPPSFNAPFYVLLHLWSSVAGTSAFALRLPTVVCAAGAVAVLAELTRRLAGPGAGLLAGLLCATGPLYVDQAVQARDYGPALLALLLCVLWFQGWLGTGRGSGRVAIAAGVAALLHWFTLPVILGLAVAGLLVRGGRAGRRLAVALAVAVVPAVALLLWSLAGGSQGAPTPPVVGLSLPLAAVRDWSLRYAPLSVGLAVAAVVGVCRSRHRVLVLCWILVPLVLITGLELIRPTYFARYLLFTLVGVVVAAGVGVASLRRRWARVVVAVTLLALSVVAVAPVLRSEVREPADAVVVLLAAEQVPGQPIVAADGRVALDLETALSLAPRLAGDLVLPPVEFTTQTTSRVVWLVRVVVKSNSIPVMPAQQRLIDAGWSTATSVVLTGRDVDLRIEQWVR